jgi:hypothetical protein
LSQWRFKQWKRLCHLTSPVPPCLIIRLLEISRFTILSFMALWWFPFEDLNSDHTPGSKLHTLTWTRITPDW